VSDLVVFSADLILAIKPSVLPGMGIGAILRPNRAARICGWPGFQKKLKSGRRCARARCLGTKPERNEALVDASSGRNANRKST
jgi:hypothetical protein